MATANGQQATAEQCGCGKPARWRTYRVGKIAAKQLCNGCLADKVGKYELTKVERLR